MFKPVDMNRITGAAKTFDVSVVEDGYIRIYGGMLTLGRRMANKRRDELSVSIEDIREALNLYDAEIQNKDIVVGYYNLQNGEGTLGNYEFVDYDPLLDGALLDGALPTMESEEK